LSGEPFKEVPEVGSGLDSWKKIQEALEANFTDHSGWVYRGQRNRGWPLSTALERALQATGMDLAGALKIEGGLLRRFQRQAHHYNIPLLPAENIPDWLSWMQHFGAPTRLLDWTYSFYVGLYFAVRDLSQSDGGEAALWAVDWRWIESEIHGPAREIFEKDRNLEDQEHFQSLLGPDTEPGILKINAFHLTRG
jgi:FRG domain